MNKPPNLSHIQFSSKRLIVIRNKATTKTGPPVLRYIVYFNNMIFPKSRSKQYKRKSTPTEVPIVLLNLKYVPINISKNK